MKKGRKRGMESRKSGMGLRDGVKQAGIVNETGEKGEA